MSDPAEIRMFDLGMNKGIEIERERIIKLLEDKLSIHFPQQVVNMVLAFIKGENK